MRSCRHLAQDAVQLTSDVMDPSGVGPVLRLATWRDSCRSCLTDLRDVAGTHIQVKCAEALLNRQGNIA
jgi:hypothetical protein